MCGRSIIFLLCLSATINIANCGDPVPVHPGEATDQTVESSLSKIGSDKALPVILFQVFEDLVPVDGLTLAQVKDGRLVSGTEFSSELGGEQLFFCPKSKEQTSKQCLAPKEFKESEPLECENEPIPTAIHYPKKNCGLSDGSYYLTVSYEICPAEETYTYKNDPYEIYDLCYNESLNNISHAVYHLHGAALLGDKLFTREREIRFDMNRKHYERTDADYYAKLQNEIKEKPSYTLQKFVPTEDMPLATSRKTTEYLGNFALQRNTLTGLWDNITKYFRDHAIANKNNEFTRLIGVFDIPQKDITIPVDEKQQVNIWITAMVEDDIANEKLKKLAVLMNNFIINDPNNQNAGQFIAKLCDDENHCGENLQQQFNAVGVQGRCCKWTKAISDLFQKMSDFTEYEMLDVKNITS